MNTNKVKDILDAMLVALDEFKTQDIKYYERQVSRIMSYIKNLERAKNEQKD